MVGNQPLSGRDLSGQALVSDQAPLRGLDPSGFDPSRVAEVLEEGDGFWRACSGCYETEDGYDVGHYPHSDLFKCKLGGGCGECGGIGVVWDSTDYEDFARWSQDQDAILTSQTRHLKNIARGICDVLSRLKSKTIGQHPKGNSIAYAEVPDWLLRQWLERVGIIETSLAQGIEARSDETLKAAQPVGQEPGPEDAPKSPQTIPTHTTGDEAND